MGARAALSAAGVTERAVLPSAALRGARWRLLLMGGGDGVAKQLAAR
jgi:hypothetical protein